MDRAGPSPPTMEMSPFSPSLRQVQGGGTTSEYQNSVRSMASLQQGSYHSLVPQVADTYSSYAPEDGHQSAEVERNVQMIMEKQAEVLALREQRERMLADQTQRSRRGSDGSPPVRPRRSSSGEASVERITTEESMASGAYAKKLYGMESSGLVKVVNRAANEDDLNKQRIMTKEEKNKWRREIDARYKVMGVKPIRTPKPRKNPYKSIIDEIEEQKVGNNLERALKRNTYQDNYDRTIMLRDIVLAVLALVTIVLTVIQLEIMYELDQHGSISWINRHAWMSEPIKVLICLLSLISIVVVLDYWRLMVVVESRRYGLKVPSMLEVPFRFPRYFIFAVVEVFVYLVLPPPYLILSIEDSSLDGNEKRFCVESSCKETSYEDSNIIPFVSEKWGLLVFLRCYIFLRVLRDQSAIYRTRRYVVDYMHNNEETRVLPPDSFGWLLTVKYLVDHLPMYFVPMTSLIVMLMFAYCIHVCERYQTDGPTTFSYMDSVWFMFITMSTIGYGDRSPTTSEGRVVTVIAGSFGLLLGALLTGVVLTQLTLSEVEQSHEKALVKMQMEHRQEQVSAEFIQNTFREWQLNKMCKKLGDSMHGSKKRRAFQYRRGKLQHDMRTLRSALSALKNSEEGNPAVDAVQNLTEVVKSNQEMLEKQLDLIQSVLLSDD